MRQACSPAPCKAAQSVRDDSTHESGPAAPERYKSVRDAKDSENPYLVIRRDGIELIAKGLASGRKTVAAVDLEQTLIELPLTAWPYGRVVTVQENRHSSGG